MKNKIKNEFDSLYQLAEQNWRDWDHKTRQEWKLSFGIWGALLAINSVLYSQELIFDVSIFYLIILLIFITILHYFFLRWIQLKLNIFRKRVILLQRRMSKLISIDPFSIDRPNKYKFSFSFWAQISITIVLSLLSIYIFINKTVV